jgi:hypothetical protein
VDPAGDRADPARNDAASNAPRRTLLIRGVDALSEWQQAICRQVRDDVH